MKSTTPPQHIIVAFRGTSRRKGFSQIPNVVTLDKSISCPAYRLYSLLVSYAMQAEGFVASQGAIAEDLGSTDRAVRNWLGELETKALISIHRQGQMKPNIYIVEDAYTLYDEEKPSAKQGAGKQASQGPPFRSPEEQRFRSSRNDGSAHGGTAVPTLKESNPKKKENNQEVLPSASQEELPLAAARRKQGDKFAFIDNLRKAGS